MPALDLERFDAMTFDCYGTLIDWERGILTALRRAMPTLELPDETLLEAFARHEAGQESGPYLPYREILGRTLLGIVSEYGAELGTDATVAADAFGASVADWPAFPDAPAALADLGARFRLGVITNCDDDLFAASELRLGVRFDEVVTAQQTRRYKPNPRGFELMFERLGLPTSRILHVAQSLYHDHVPAKRLGLATVWVNRRAGRAGGGATPAATAAPDLEVPDLRTLADLAVAVVPR